MISRTANKFLLSTEEVTNGIDLSVDKESWRLTYLGISLVFTVTKVIFRLPELFIIYLTKKNVLESGRGIF